MIKMIKVAGIVKKDNMSRDVRKLGFGVSDQVKQKPACTVTEPVQSQKKARSLKFRI